MAVTSVMSTTELVPTTETATATETETATSTVVRSVPTTVVRTTVKTAVTTVTTVPRTVNVTVTAEPAGASVPDGDYIIGTDIQPGTYQCKDPGEVVYWATSDQSGELLDNDLGSIARVTSSAYAVKLDDCSVDWKRAG